MLLNKRAAAERRRTWAMGSSEKGYQGWLKEFAWDASVSNFFAVARSYFVRSKFV
jgi:hypothetical protein